MITRKRLAAALRRLLEQTPRPPRQWPAGQVEHTSGAELLAGVKAGRFVVVSRAIAERIVAELEERPP